MKKMAAMHMNTVKDARSRRAIERQMSQWDENLETLYVDHYRLRCYASSLQGNDPPVPKVGQFNYLCCLF